MLKKIQAHITKRPFVFIIAAVVIGGVVALAYRRKLKKVEELAQKLPASDQKAATV